MRKFVTFAAFVSAAALILSVPVLGAGDGGGGKEAKPARPDEGLQVVRYVGAEQGTAWGRPVLKITVSDIAGKSVQSLVVPNQDPMARKYDPAPAVVEIIKDLKKGDPLHLAVVNFQGVNMLQAIRKYDMKPGEEQADSYLFVSSEEKEVAKKKNIVVTLSKFGQEAQVLVPLKKVEKVEQPDPEIAGVVQGLTQGDMVTAEIVNHGRPELAYIGAYIPPVDAEMVKLNEEKTDEGPKATLEVKVGGESRTYPVASKPVGTKTAPDANVIREAKKYKEAAPITLRLRKVGGNEVVSEILKRVEKVEKNEEKREEPAKKGD